MNKNKMSKQILEDARNGIIADRPMAMIESLSKKKDKKIK